MGFRFQRRLKILPGVHINLSRSGVGFSVGGRGAHVGISAKGQRYTSVGVPGTGVSWREYERAHHIPPPCPHCAPGQMHIPLWLVVVLAAMAAVAVLLSGK